MFLCQSSTYCNYPAKANQNGLTCVTKAAICNTKTTMCVYKERMPNSKVAVYCNEPSNCSHKWAFVNNKAAKHKNIDAILLHKTGKFDNKAVLLHLLASIVLEFATEKLHTMSFWIIKTTQQQT